MIILINLFVEVFEGNMIKYGILFYFLCNFLFFSCIQINDVASNNLLKFNIKYI